MSYVAKDASVDPYSAIRPWHRVAASAAPRRSLNTTDGVVSVTAQAWDVGGAAAEPTTGPRASAAPVSPDAIGVDLEYAVPALRDQFLAALDAGNGELCRQLALGLTGCSNPLPGLTCLELGLPPGSSYGRAARHLLAAATHPGATS